MDEIYIKLYLDFKGGEIIGISVNSDKATAFVFMIQSITSRYKDVSVMPVHKVYNEVPLDLSLPKNHIVHILKKFNFSR